MPEPEPWRRNSRNETLEKSIGGIFETAYGRPHLGGDRARPKLPRSVDGQVHQPGKRGITPKSRGGKTRPFGSFPKRNYPDFQRRQLGTGKQLDHRSDCPTDRIHPNAHVNTLLSQSAWNHQKQGWSFGVTSAKSAYEPRTSSCSSPVRTSGETSSTG